MKLFIINKKTTGIYIIIIGLMLVMLGVENKFDERLKTTSLIYNNIKALKAYSIKDISYTYKLPKSWTTEEEKFPGGEIVYHNSFISNDGNLHGYVQVWQLRRDLENFIQDIKKNSEVENSIYEYKVSDYKYGNLKGFKVLYKIKTKNDNYVAYEYFIKLKDNFIRFSFYTKEKDFKESMESNFETIVRYLKEEAAKN